MQIKKALIIFSFSLIFFGLGFYFGKTQCKICPPEDLDFSLFWQAYSKLKENFFEKEKVSPPRIIYGAISGMVKSLEDPYTVFLTPEETKFFQQEVKGYFGGVGMEVGIKEGKLKVISPLEASPAQRAGIKSGDIILEIDGKSTEGMSLEEAVRLIRGEKGTKVKLKILREGWEKPREIEIIREIIKIPSLKWEEKEKIIYLKIYQFSEKTDSDFVLAARKILNLPTKKMILDLRDNPGGILEIAVNVGSWFLEKGKVIAIEDLGEGKKEIFESKGPGKFSDYKIVVLINQGSASGAEILAAALKENLGVILIGERTFGKGSVQKLENLKGGSSLKITVGKWLTPSGKEISENGLEPDIQVKNQNEKDLQLEKAIEIFKNL